MNKKLYRSKENKMLAGVCGGLADYLGIDVSLIRIAFAVGSLFACVAVIAYIICAAIIPMEP